ncbi:hypothetical protein PCS_01957 [Desulfocurvibacter africanus PCS]|uniref:Uncharacterized protein n=1 Tax=Desulfocurvibacter africanus PCS TaxID=1262666 RepID=M5PRV7_DESAF|nr:hypothetical protein [Desulfocurvibacter africanus]EMG37122.1 hypothetical protein PCS_01957 [Desulfocurvibacter africanus PCS]
MSPVVILFFMRLPQICGQKVMEWGTRKRSEVELPLSLLANFEDRCLSHAHAPTTKGFGNASMDNPTRDTRWPRIVSRDRRMRADDST